jgi:DNA-directed RNA polymerase subunit RPC12/RpoP
MSEHEGPYYPVSYVYAGPNPAEAGGTNHPGNRDHYMIRRSPGQTNMSHEECIDGWLGQTGDWSATAIGELGTLDEAREACEQHEGSELRAIWQGSGLNDEDPDVVLALVPLNIHSGHLLAVDWDGEDPDGGLDYPEVTLRNEAEWLYSGDTNTSEFNDAWDVAAGAIGAEHPGNFDVREDIIAHLEATGWEVEQASHGDFCFIVGKRPPQQSELGDNEPMFAGTLSISDKCPHCGGEVELAVELDDYREQDETLTCPTCKGRLWVRVKVGWFTTEDARDHA